MSPPPAASDAASSLQEVQVAPLSPDRMREVLSDEAWEKLQGTLERARDVLDGRVVWNVNSTALGGGVAELLRTFLAYSRGAGLDLRWAVMNGEPEFFRVTKRIHNLLHGHPGDGGELGAHEKAVYEAVTERNARELAAVVRPEDAVILHDPQTAGLVPKLKETGAAVVWRSHVGAERPNEQVHAAWEFLAPWLAAADACVFTRHAYVPEWANAIRTDVIQPSIDVFSPKNQEMTADAALTILSHVGLVVQDGQEKSVPTFTRYDGTPGRVDRMCEVLSTGPPPGPSTPTVVQVSRWDRLKDPIGVMLGFADYVNQGSDAHLILAGPTVHSVADDPEGGEVLDETEARWRELPHAVRSRVHLSCLPMHDFEENAAIVNALQRHATVIVQKSLQEGFGLTVAEAMWKSRPVVASAVGGIQDQIEDGVSGILLQDPSDLEAFGAVVLDLLNDPERAGRIGARAREHVRAHFLIDRHAGQYVELLMALLAQARAAEA